MRQTKKRPENLLFLKFVYHMKPMGEENRPKKFQPISPINGRVMENWKKRKKWKSG